jgi:hypothetical protein
MENIAFRDVFSNINIIAINVLYMENIAFRDAFRL